MFEVCVHNRRLDLDCSRAIQSKRKSSRESQWGIPRSLSRRAISGWRRNRGYFENTVWKSIRFLRGGRVATQALAAGEPPIVNVGTVIQANLTGYNLVLIISMENKFYQLVFVRPGIASLEQLKGKKLGISGFGSITHYAAQILLKHLNLETQQRRGIDRGRTGRGATGRHERRQDRRVIFQFIDGTDR